VVSREGRRSERPHDKQGDCTGENAEQRECEESGERGDDRNTAEDDGEADGGESNSGWGTYGEGAESVGGFDEIDVTADAGEAEDADTSDGDGVGVEEEPRGGSSLLHVKQVGWGDEEGAREADEGGGSSPQRAIIESVASDGHTLFDSRDHRDIRASFGHHVVVSGGCGTRSGRSVCSSASVSEPSPAESTLYIQHATTIRNRGIRRNHLEG